jgi:hypothetical protein
MGFCIFHQFSLTTMKKLLYFLVLALIYASHLSVAQRFRVSPRPKKPELEQAARLRYRSLSSERRLIEIQKELTKYGFTADPYRAALIDAKARRELMKALRTNKIGSTVSSTGPMIGPPPKQPSIGRTQPEAPATENLEAAADKSQRSPRQCCPKIEIYKARQEPKIKAQLSEHTRAALQTLGENLGYQDVRYGNMLSEAEIRTRSMNAALDPKPVKIYLDPPGKKRQHRTSIPVRAQRNGSMAEVKNLRYRINRLQKVDFVKGTIEFTLKNGPLKIEYETVGQMRDDHGKLYKNHEIKENLDKESFHDVRENLLEGKLLEVFRKSGYTNSKLQLEFMKDGYQFHLQILESPIKGEAPIVIDECQLGGKRYMKTITRML